MSEDGEGVLRQREREKKKSSTFTCPVMARHSPTRPTHGSTWRNQPCGHGTSPTGLFKPASVTNLRKTFATFTWYPNDTVSLTTKSPVGMPTATAHNVSCYVCPMSWGRQNFHALRRWSGMALPYVNWTFWCQQLAKWNCSSAVLMGRRVLTPSKIQWILDMWYNFDMVNWISSAQLTPKTCPHRSWYGEFHQCMM